MTRREYLLIKAAEECAEVAQRCTKALTFGLSEIQTGQPYTNAERVLHEYADLAAVVDMLLDCGALPRGMFEEKKEGEGGWDERVEKKKAALGLIYLGIDFPPGQLGSGSFAVNPR